MLIYIVSILNKMTIIKFNFTNLRLRSSSLPSNSKIARSEWPAAPNCSKIRGNPGGRLALTRLGLGKSIQLAAHRPLPRLLPLKILANSRLSCLFLPSALHLKL